MANNGAANKSKVIASMIVGIVIGVTIAGFVAWYMTQKNSASFREPPVARDTAKPLPLPVANLPAPRAPAADQARQFEFYRVLPDKADGTAARSEAATVKPRAKPSVKAGDTMSYIVQAGSFQSAADAEKLKARLALVGMEASVQSIDLPGKGIWHRVRLGPYQGLNAANETIANLKSNGVADATAIHAQ
ncbi:MAG: SPOR domain-containing protein [Sideroxyarcus sp.]|nr:SPOR domain-containing protein [Sideroxyarcus sp.]